MLVTNIVIACKSKLSLTTYHLNDKDKVRKIGKTDLHCIMPHHLHIVCYLPAGSSTLHALVDELRKNVQASNSDWRINVFHQKEELLQAVEQLPEKSALFIPVHAEEKDTPLLIHKVAQSLQLSKEIVPIFSGGYGLDAKHQLQLYQNGVWYVFDFEHTPSPVILKAIEQALLRVVKLHHTPLQIQKWQERFHALLQRCRLLEQELEESKEELLEAYKELTEALEGQVSLKKTASKLQADLDSFLYKLSHDIQGPVASLQGLGNLARLDINDPTALDYVEKMMQNIGKLQKIVQGLQKVVKIRYATQEIELIDFHQLLFQLRNEYNSLCNKLNVKIRSQIDSKQPFFASHSLIYTILQHLIENALIHGLSQRKKLEETAYIDVIISSNSRQCLLLVIDEGVGIPKEAHDRLFDLFFKYNPDSKGTGVGLYIVKSCVEQLHGNIEVESEVGKGTTFRVIIPNHHSRK